MQHFVVVEDVLSDTDDEKLNTPAAAVVEGLSSSTWSPPKVRILPDHLINRQKGGGPTHQTQ